MRWLTNEEMVQRRPIPPTDQEREEQARAQARLLKTWAVARAESAVRREESDRLTTQFFSNSEIRRFTAPLWRHLSTDPLNFFGVTKTTLAEMREVLPTYTRAIFREVAVRALPTIGVHWLPQAPDHPQITYQANKASYYATATEALQQMVAVSRPALNLLRDHALLLPELPVICDRYVELPHKVKCGMNPALAGFVGEFPEAKVRLLYSVTIEADCRGFESGSRMAQQQLRLACFLTELTYERFCSELPDFLHAQLHTKASKIIEYHVEDPPVRSVTEKFYLAFAKKRYIERNEFERFTRDLARCR